jgi:signal transduction histidine kinase
MKRSVRNVLLCASFGCVAVSLVWMGIGAEMTASVQLVMTVSALLCLALIGMLNRPSGANAPQHTNQEVFRLYQHAPLSVLLVDESGKIVMVRSPPEHSNLLTESNIEQSVEDCDALRVLLEHIQDGLAGRPWGPGKVTVAGREWSGSVQPLDTGVLVMFGDPIDAFPANRVRTDFVANVSHELRTPIATILGYAETLLADSENLATDEKLLVEAIFRNSTRLRDLFEDILTLARVETRNEGMPTEEKNLRVLLLDICAATADMAYQRGINFALDCPDDLFWMLNEEAVQTVTRNLALNAVKYTPEGGTVNVRIFEDKGFLNLIVQDTGMGIAKENHDRIFERFFRVDAGRSRAIGGSGLGLSVVKHLVHAMGATIQVESTEGEGATFIVQI